MCTHPVSTAPPEKSGKGPGSVSVYFLSTITSQNFEEPIRFQNETTWNVIPSHAHEAKSADYAIWYSNSSVSPTYVHSGIASMGDWWTIEIRERCLPTLVIAAIVC